MSKPKNDIASLLGLVYNSLTDPHVGQMNTRAEASALGGITCLAVRRSNLNPEIRASLWLRAGAFLCEYRNAVKMAYTIIPGTDPLSGDSVFYVHDQQGDALGYFELHDDYTPYYAFVHIEGAQVLCFDIGAARWADYPNSTLTEFWRMASPNPDAGHFVALRIEAKDFERTLQVVADQNLLAEENL